MKIAIISDIHDNLVNLKTFLSFVKKEGVKIIFCCGDLTSPEILDYLIFNFKGKIFLTLGNADQKKEILEKFSKGNSKLTLFEGFGEAKLKNLKIAFSHLLEEIKNPLQKYDFVFYGHNHRPSLENLGKTIILNPGNLAGLYYKATFAILDTENKKIDLKILEKIKNSTCRPGLG